MRELYFEKYEAAGNDFVVVDARSDESVAETWRNVASKACERHFGIGADGVLVITRTMADFESVCVDAAMHVINSDGSIAAMCGNGIRCVARYLYEFCGFEQNRALKIATLGGLQTVRFLSASDRLWLLEVEMAKANVGEQIQIQQGSRVWNGTFVDVGNPHTVFEIQDSPEKALAEAGEFLSNHPTYPERCNIEFIRMRNEKTLDLTVYERGVGPTCACGTGCVAAACAYAQNHSINGANIEIHAPGGVLNVVTSCSPKQPVLLKGPACHVFSGKYLL